MNGQLSTKAMESTAKIAEQIANGREILPDSAVRLTLPEFKNLYVEIVNQLGNRNPYVVLIFLNDQVMAMFPQYSGQRIQIMHSKEKQLQAADFEFVIYKQLHGVRNKLQSFRAFLGTEIRLYWKWLMLSFTLSALGLHFTGSESTYSLLSGLLIQSATVFVSIFLIFTVTQSALIQQDVSLFRSGLLHKYRRDDRNVAILGILTIGGVILNSMFISYPGTLEIVLQGYKLNLYNFWGAITTGLVITLLLDAFISIINYYLDRSQDLVDRDLTNKIFEDEVEYIKVAEKNK